MGREEVRFSSGGDECAAWLYRPAAAGAPAPCVVMGSGLSCVRDQGLDAFGERFAAAGVAVLAFDYRHFGDSAGEPRGLMDAGRQRDDFRAALSFARRLGAVDPNRIALWGYSLGGGHVQSLALTEPGIAAAICVVPVVNGLRSLAHIAGPTHPLRLAAAGLRDAARALRHAEPHRIPAAGPPGSVAVLNSPDSAPGFASITPTESSWRNELCARAVLAPPYRLEKKAPRIACPILYAITEQDDINPPALGIEVAASAPRGELRRYPGGHFDPFLGETFERMAVDQVDFLQRAL
ncbi:MAG TPA: alpha/beta fold hydrolase [Solirubrobacterales bacterium]